MKLLEGKVALVTGATRGIGRAIALRFAEQGANVAFTYLSSVAAAESLVTEVESLGVRAIGFASNAADFADAHKVVEQTIAEFGALDILVNNAGQTKDTLMLRMSEEQWDSIIDTNLKSAFNFIHAAVPAMIRRRSGTIINMSSVVGTNGNAGQCNYAASKAGIIGLTQSIAKEVGSRKVRVNAIAPGFIETDMTDKLNDATKQAIISSVSLGRMGSANEIADVALFLTSDMSSYITGEVIKVTGGMR